MTVDIQILSALYSRCSLILASPASCQSFYSPSFERSAFIDSERVLWPRRLFRRREATNKDRFANVVERALCERYRDLHHSNVYSPETSGPDGASSNDCRSADSHTDSSRSAVDWTALRSRWLAILNSLDALTKGKSSDGNRLTLICESTVDALVSSIRSAKTRVWIQSYIFDDSPVAELVVDELLRAKERGLDVVLVIDWLGSLAMRQEWKRRLSNGGVDFVEFQDWKRPAHRNHRKIFIIDDFGYCGSTNVMKEAGSVNIGGDASFFDIMIKIEGPAVSHLADVFIDSLVAAGSGVVRESIAPPIAIPYALGGGAFVQVLEG